MIEEACLFLTCADTSGDALEGTRDVRRTKAMDRIPAPPEAGRCTPAGGGNLPVPSPGRKCGGVQFQVPSGEATVALIRPRFLDDNDGADWRALQDERTRQYVGTSSPSVSGVCRG